MLGLRSGDCYEWCLSTCAEEQRHAEAHAEEQRHVVKTAVKPSIFDGSTPWQDYYAQFEILSQINGWQGTDKAMYLASCLREQAQAV